MAVVLASYGINSVPVLTLAADVVQGSIVFGVTANPAILGGVAVVGGILTARAAYDVASGAYSVARGTYSLGKWAFSAKTPSNVCKSSKLELESFVLIHDSKALEKAAAGGEEQKKIKID